MQEKEQKTIFQLHQKATIWDAIQKLKDESIPYLLTEDKVKITRNNLLQFYESGFSLDTEVRDLFASNFPERMIDHKILLTIIENIPFSIYVTDDEGKSVLANEEFIQSTGLTRKELLSKDVYSMVQKGIYSPAVTPIVIREKRIVSINQQLKEDKHTVVTGIPIFDSNDNVSFVLTISQNVKPNNTFTVRHETNTTKGNIVYKSKVMDEIVQIATQVSNVNSTVLITGESGVGKDVIANLIHAEGERSKEPFVHLNCGAIPEQLLESELFGYEPGTFTGGDRKGKQGHIEAANNGTLFLDEIGEMSLSLQVKLLQVLQNKQITRMGSTKPIDVDIRIIAATNRDLQEDIKRGLFRLDLYYRLNVIPIYIPPLRERKEDIIPLAYYFLEKYNRKNNKKFKLTVEIEQTLLTSTWPGNIRELENFIERLVVIERNDNFMANSLQAGWRNEPIEVHDIIPLKQAIEIVEKKLIEKAVKVEGNSYKVASLLKISQSSAHRKMQKYLH